MLDIPFYELDLRAYFRETVVADFCRAYGEGRTPNPCARCNEWIKFGKLLDHARALGAQFVATGHYVRKEWDDEAGRAVLRMGKGQNDQSYFLFGLTQEQLRDALFPLGEYCKDEVREMARRMNLPVHGKPGSQDLCFLPDGKYREFLRAECPDAFRPGPVLHVSGKRLGRHEGIADYTVGQRRGLGIAHAEPLYVVGFRPGENAVVVGERRHVLRDEVILDEVNWLSVEPPRGPVEATVKIRYNHPGAEARVIPEGDGRVRVAFTEPQEAPCPGQAAVFYCGTAVLGGGTIESALNGREQIDGEP
jgi:tRNA-specific 2-thiouridylase